MHVHLQKTEHEQMKCQHLFPPAQVNQMPWGFLSFCFFVGFSSLVFSVFWFDGFTFFSQFD